MPKSYLLVFPLGHAHSPHDSCSYEHLNLEQKLWRMAQRRGETITPPGRTELVTSGLRSAISNYSGSKYIQRSTLGRSNGNCLSAEAADSSKVESHERHLPTPSASSSSLTVTDGNAEKGQESLLKEYLKIKKDRTAAVIGKLNKDASTTKLQAARIRQDGSLPEVVCGQTNQYCRRKCPSSLSTSCEKWIGQASSGFLHHLANMWKQKACREVEQFRGDLDSFEYTMPVKTEQQLMALNRSQLIEYIGLLHKDSQYVGQLAVESKTKLQRMSAEVEYLNKQVQSLKQELEVQAALYMDKMNRHPARASCSVTHVD